MLIQLDAYSCKHPQCISTRRRTALVHILGTFSLIGSTRGEGDCLDFTSMDTRVVLYKLQVPILCSRFPMLIRQYEIKPTKTI